MNNSITREMMGSMVCKREETEDDEISGPRERKTSDSERLMTLPYNMADALEDTAQNSKGDENSQILDGFLASIPMPPRTEVVDRDSTESSSSSSSSSSSTTLSSSSSSAVSSQVEDPPQPSTTESMVAQDLQETPAVEEDLQNLLLDSTGPDSPPGDQLMDSSALESPRPMDEPDMAESKACERTTSLKLTLDDPQDDHLLPVVKECVSNLTPMTELDPFDVRQSPSAVEEVKPIEDRQSTPVQEVASIPDKSTESATSPPPPPAVVDNCDPDPDPLPDQTMSVNIVCKSPPTTATTTPTPSAGESHESSSSSSKKSSRWDRDSALQRTPEKPSDHSVRVFSSIAAATASGLSPTVVMARGVRRGLSFANNLGFRMCYQGNSLRISPPAASKTQGQDHTTAQDKCSTLPPSEEQRPSPSAAAVFAATTHDDDNDVQKEPANEIALPTVADDAHQHPCPSDADSQQNRDVVALGNQESAEAEDVEMKPSTTGDPATSVKDYEETNKREETATKAEDASGRPGTSPSAMCRFQKPVKVGKFKFLANSDEVNAVEVLCNGLGLSMDSSSSSITRLSASSSPCPDDSDSGGCAPGATNTSTSLSNNNTSCVNSDDNSTTATTDSQSDSGARDVSGLASQMPVAIVDTESGGSEDKRRKGAGGTSTSARKKKGSGEKNRPDEERRRSSRIRSIAERREKEREERQQSRAAAAKVAAEAEAQATTAVEQSDQAVESASKIGEETREMKSEDDKRPLPDFIDSSEPNGEESASVSVRCVSELVSKVEEESGPYTGSSLAPGPVPVLETRLGAESEFKSRFPVQCPPSSLRSPDERNSRTSLELSRLRASAPPPASFVHPPPPPPMKMPISDNFDYNFLTTTIAVDMIPLPPMPPPPRPHLLPTPILPLPVSSYHHHHHQHVNHHQLSPGFQQPQRRHNSSSPASGGEDGGGSGSGSGGGGGRPEKVKSRWRRNSELERVCSSNPPMSSSFSMIHGPRPPPPSDVFHPAGPGPQFNQRQAYNCATSTSAIATSTEVKVTSSSSSPRPQLPPRQPPFDILMNGGPPPPPPPVCGFFDPDEVTEDWSEKEMTSSLSNRPLPQRPRINQSQTSSTSAAPTFADAPTAAAVSAASDCRSTESAKSSPIQVASSPKPEKPAHLNFDEIAENMYLSERRRSKSKREVRRMVCDCTITKDEVDEGFVACGDDCLNRLLMMECGSRCPTGDRCTNRRFQKRQYANIAAFKTEKKGWGLKAHEDLPAGSFVLEYVGEVLDQREFKRRVKEYAHDRHRHYYFMALRNDEIIDATQKGNLSRFINHSCDPNCETQKWTVNGDLRVGFFTRCLVAAGDELTFDYQFQRYGKEAQRCYCESSNCRGFIGGDKQTPLRKDRRDAKRKKAAEERRREELEDMDLEQEIEKFSHLGGLKNRTQTLNLCRLMVRADDIEFRVVLLQSLQKTSEQACLRLFLDYHGLSLLWSWMVDISNSDENLTLKSEILKTLQKLPISNKNVLMDSKVMSVVQRWAVQIAEVGHRHLNKGCLVSSEEDQLPPTLTKENGLTMEDSCSDSDSLQPPIDASAASVKEEVPSPDASDASHRIAVIAATTSTTDDETLLDNHVDAEAAADVIVEKLPDENDDKEDIVVKVEPAAECCDLPATDDAICDDGPPMLSEDGPPMFEDATTNDASSLVDVKMETFDAIEDSDGAEEGELPSLAEESDQAIEEGELVSPCGDEELKDDGDELSPPVLNNEAQLAEQSRKLRDEGEFASLAKELLDTWSNLKEVYRIPKREQNLNRREHEREADKRESEERERDRRDRYRDRERDRDRDGRQDRHRDRHEHDQRSSKSSDYDRGRRSRDSHDSPSSRDQRKTRDRDRRSRDDEEPERKRFVLYDDSRRQRQVERRREFELKVQQEEEQAVRTQAALDYIQQYRVEHEAQTLESTPIYYDPNYGPMHGPHLGCPLPPPGTPMPFFEPNPQFVIPPMAMGPPPDPMMIVSAIPTPDAMVECATPSANESPTPNPGATPAQLIFPVYPPPGAAPVPPGYVGPPPPGPVPHFIPPPQGQPIYYPPPQAVVNLPDQVHPWTAQVIQTPILEESSPPPEPPRAAKPGRLPSNWRMATDDEGTVYYYHSVSRQTQWEPPVCEESDMDLGTPTYDEPKPKKKKNVMVDTSSESARRIKEGFRMKMSQFVVQCLNPFRKPDCKMGRISSTEEFKHLARKLTHAVMAKELKHCRNVEDLECNENVRHKAKDFVRKYMSKFGAVYKKSPKDDDDDED